MREISINIKTKKYGQVAKYGHSEFEYILDVKGMYDSDIKKYCTELLMPCKQTFEEWENGRNDDDYVYFGGYYIFEQIEETDYDEGKYRYFVYNPSTH